MRGRQIQYLLQDAVVKFITYRNLQRHRAILPEIARLLYMLQNMSK